MSKFSSDLPANTRFCTLREGTPAKVRPIRADGGAKLTAALEQLSPEARYQRFLSGKSSFSPSELDYLTHCDGVNHLALVLVITDAQGNELAPVAVARCVRDPEDSSLAEVAITVADEWQGKGAGSLLFQALADAALAVGIRNWQALLLSSNSAAFKLLEMVGTRQSAHAEGVGTFLVTYRLHSPVVSNVASTPEETPPYKRLSELLKGRFHRK